MAYFHLTTAWDIPASIEACWFSILEVETWPDWWKYVDNVIELAPGDASGVNNIHRYNWSTCLPYHLVFDLHVTELVPFKLIEFDIKGDLTGTGCCIFSKKNNSTQIQFDWNVHTNKAWMSFLSTIAYPVFEWNHCRVMQSGQKSFIRRLKLTP